MAHYENVVLISEAIGAQIRETIGDWRSAMNEANETLKGVIDPYSMALLMDGITNQQRVDTSYVPYDPIEGDLRMVMVEVFEALGIQTSQCEAHRLAGKFRKGYKLNRNQLAAVTSIPKIAKLVEKITNWQADAKVVSTAISQNLPKLASVTDEEKAFAKSLSFDWHYDYSDDAQAWRHGKAQHKVVVESVKRAVAENRALEKVAVTVAAFNRLGANFFFAA